MKILRKFIFLALGMIAVSGTMTSCLSDSDTNTDNTYHELTASDKTTIMSNLTGSYTGYLKYVNNSATTDSVKTYMTFNSDTTATVQMPVAFLSQFLSTVCDSTTQAILAKAPVQTVEFQSYVPSYVVSTYWTSQWAAGTYQMYMLPKSEDITYTADGHTFTITLLSDYLSYGYSTYSPILLYTKGTINAYILIKSVKVDNTTRNLNMPTMFVGK